MLTDEKWLLFVIEQLLSNALKYTNIGEVSMYIENNCLVIKNSGIGIEEEDLPDFLKKVCFIILEDNSQMW